MSKRPTAHSAPRSASPPLPSSSSSSSSSSVSSRPSDSSSEFLVDSSKKWRSAWTRFYTTFLMLGGFILLVYLGHFALVGLVFACQIAMFKEIKRLSTILSPSQPPLSSFRPLHWYWFVTASFFAYGRVFESIFHITIPYHTFISSCFYILGFVIFVMSLTKGYYRYQFETFAWVHLTLVLVVIQSTFIVLNMFSGLIWFILPALLIISNDTWAYVYGFFFGRTPLIALSPKKTVEGFIGGGLMTLLTGFFLPVFLSRYSWLICPKNDFTWSAPTCEASLPFIAQPYQVPELLASLWGSSHVNLLPIQLHGLILALFASAIAPFGGFFASGFKRAFSIKDFGESIPGHGGVTDRMDCQILNGLFTYVYFNSFVRTSVDLASVIALVQLLETDDQRTLLQVIQQTLTQRGIAELPLA